MAELSEFNANPITLQIEDQIIGETIETNDYYFCDVGAAVSVMSDGSSYDTNNPPLKPLVISQRFGLIFVAHSKGFCVVKTKDIIAAAKKSKDEGSCPSVQELSVVDVLVGRVSILSLSLDSLFVVAVVGGEIQGFSVDSLLKKDKTPTFSCFVESNHVKDILWIKETEPSFISLTDNGKLLLGATNKPLKHVMDEVDAIGTSMDGSFVAVARQNKLNILSPKFKEIVKMSLPTDNWAGENNTIKVDCIRWVRSDSIVVGCFQQTENGNEENYFIQVITSKDGHFIDDSPKLVSVDFNDLFTSIVDDIVPCGGGPYLFVNYLENCELAFLSNRKNTDEHVMLLNWSQGDNQVSLVYIDRDKWLPRIQLQENGNENLIFGLGVDESAVYENVKVSVGVEEERELPPHCVLVCLTLEGKLVMFNVASIAGSQRLSTAYSNVQNMSVVGPSVLGESLQLGEESSKQSASNLGLHDSDTKEISSALDEVPIKKDDNSSAQNKYTLGTLNFDQNIRKEVDAEKRSQSAVLDISNSKPFGLLGQSQEVKSNLFSFSVVGDTVGTEKLKIGGIPLTDKPVEKNLTSTSLGVEDKAGFHVSNSTSIPTTAGKSSGSLGISSEKPLFSSQTFAKSILPSSSPASTDKLNSSGSLFRNFGSRPSDTFSSAGQATNQSQKIISGSDVPGSAFRNTGSKMQLQEVGKLQNITAHPILGNDRKVSVRPGNAEHNLPKQFSNVHNMAKELDKLLESIEEAGGFREACTTAHKSSLQALEEAMDNLSERNRVCQSLTEEQHREIQLLLDNTVQVLARKTHMEGIVRQTSDLQYWDLWNRQKLSSELEQKRNNLLNRNQELINQMIELEKHFNTLELNLFGDRSGVNLVSRTLNSRSAPSRNSQSLHAIHNATISQLAAAKQLSDSLSKQMAVLSIKSPPTKHTNVKKQVFDSIGIPYPDDTLNSPNTARVMDSPSNRLSLATCSGEARNESKRIHLNGVSSHDLETSRRRRDSLDRNLANFEAPKTTVKRMVVQNELPKFGGLFSSREKQSASPVKLEGSVATYSKVVPVQDRNDRKGMPQKLDSVSHGTSNFKWVGGSPQLSQAEPELTSIWKLSQGDKFSTSTSSISSSSSLSKFVDPNTKKDNSVSTPERRGIQIENINRFDGSDTTSSVTKSSLSQLGATPERPGTLIENMNRFDSSGSTSSVTKPSLPQFGEAKSTSQKIQPSAFSFSLSSGHTPTSGTKETESAKPFGGQNFLNVSTSKKDSETSTSSGVLSGSSASLPKPNIQTSPLTSVENESTTSTNMGKTVNKDVFQFPSTPFSASSPLAAPLSSLASKDSKEASKFPTSVVSLPASPAAPVSSVSSKSTEVLHTDSSGSLNPAKEPTKIAPEAESVKVSAESNMASTPQSPENLSPSSFGLNFAQMTPSSPPTEVPKAIASNPDLNKFVTPEVSNTTRQKQITADSSSPAPPLELGGPTAGKSNIEAIVAGEDEMDEEAPETNQTVNYSLGSFGGFGLGSTPSSTAMKSNPFGGPITSAPQNVASSVSLSVPSGELFRPASFSFPSMQPSQPSQSSSFGAPSGTFGFANPQQGLPGSSFGQPLQIGSQQSSPGSGFGQPSQIGSGQQALGSVLGSFGQSRQLGTGLPGSGFGVPQSVGGFSAISSTSGGFGGGFANAATTGGGFAAAATGGGFAAAASGAGGGFTAAAPAGGFAAAAPSGGGFAAAAPSGGGFAAAAPSGGGFAAAAGGGGGFGAFSKPGGSGFSGFGGGGAAGGRQAPPELFTQMRK